MGNLKNVNIMSKHEALVYKVFRENQQKALSARDIEQLLHRENQRLSTRTVYRMVEKLQHKKIIYCTDMQKGLRYFHLVEDYRVEILCQKCGWTAKIDMQKTKAYCRLHNCHINPLIIGGKITFNGTCQQCRIV